MKTMNTQECTLGQRSTNLWHLMVLKGNYFAKLYLEFQKKHVNNSQGNDNLKIHIGVLTKFLTNNKMGGYSKWQLYECLCECNPSEC